MAVLQVQQHNANVLESLEAGDLVEFKRGVYSHWAVYIGNEQVIHLTADGSVFSISALVLCFQSVVYTIQRLLSKRKTFGQLQATANSTGIIDPFTAAEIIRRARAKLGNIHNHVLWSNCEHFASFCRYGNPKSDQAVFIGYSILAGGVVAFAFSLFRALRG